MLLIMLCSQANEDNSESAHACVMTESLKHKE